MNKFWMVALTATLLGGCQSIFGHHAKLEVRPIGAGITSSAAAAQLEEGKQFLLQGQVASAIVAFQKAALEPDTAAAAHNGLGAAYAQLGRGDLSERYFQHAVSEDPGEAKYAANLARFYQSREAALVKARVPTAVAVMSEAHSTEEVAWAKPVDRQVESSGGSGKVTVMAHATRLTRLSAQEVSIRTAPEASASTADARRRNPRYVSAPTATAATRYPIRITLDR